MTSVSALPTGTWTVDPAHTEVGFVARHLMVSKVRGQFKEFEATVIVGDSFATSAVQATVQAGLDRHRQRRPRRAPDVAPTSSTSRTTPVMTFVSTSVSADSSMGDLTIKGVTRQVDFDLDFAGVTRRPVGRHPRRLRGRPPRSTARTSAWTWNVAVEGGGVLVGEKVKIVLDVQLVKA